MALSFRFEETEFACFMGWFFWVNGVDRVNSEIWVFLVLKKEVFVISG